MEIITRKAARAQGLLYYFTGIACKHAHLSIRYVSSGGCIGCKTSEESRVKRSGYHKSPQAKALQAVVRKSEKRKEYMKAYNAKPEAKAAKVKYMATNAGREVRKKGSYVRRAKEDTGKVSKGIERKLLELQRRKCAICKAELKGRQFHIDHIMPLALGGLNEDGNLQIACPTCNLRKSKKHPVDFMQSIGFLL